MNLLNKITEIKFVQSLIELAKRIRLPGFEGVPLFDVLVFFVRGLMNGNLSTRASSLAFFFFLAIFPFVIFLFTLIPYIPIDNLQEQLLSLFKNFMPSAAYEATESTIVDIISQKRSGLLSIGFISALYLSANGFNAMMDSFNQSIHLNNAKLGFKKWGKSLALLFILTSVAVVSIGLIVVSEIILNKIQFIDAISSYLIVWGRAIIILAMLFFAISFLYYMGPASKERYRLISAGSTLATLLFILVCYGFAFYVNNFGQYNKLYGSIGTLIVVMTWLYLSCIILLIGFELNASIYSAKHQKSNI